MTLNLISRTSSLLFFCLLMMVNTIAMGAGPSKQVLCEGISGEFTAILLKGTGTCQIDADCGCYGAMSPGSPCGGIIDAKTAGLLKPLENEFLKAGCDFYAACAPWMCVPVCVDKKCVNSRDW